MKTKEIGLLFTPENLRLVPPGLKTQTRRGNGLDRVQAAISAEFIADARVPNWVFRDHVGGMVQLKCPYGNPQVEPVRYYLKEAVRVLRIDDSKLDYITADIHYPGDGILRSIKTVQLTPADYAKLLARRDWREPSSPMFMLKSFARHWVDGVRTWPERLGDMSDDDAVAEGIEYDPMFAKVGAVGSCDARYWRDYLTGGIMPCRYDLTPLQSYASLWNSINGPGSWQPDTWVWCVSWKSPANGGL